MITLHYNNYSRYYNKTSTEIKTKILSLFLFVVVKLYPLVVSKIDSLKFINRKNSFFQ